MSTINLPKTTFNLVAAPTPVDNAPQQILFIGQQVDATSPDGVLIKNVGFSGQEDALFGRKSMLAYMIRGFREINAVSRVDAIPLDAAGGATAATATISFSGLATAVGTLSVVVQSKRNFTFNVTIPSGSTPAAVATALETAINSSDAILVSALATVGDVDLTSLMLGTFGNTIAIRIESLPPGITDTITAFAGGAGDPTTSAIFTQLENIRYQTVVYPDYFQALVKDFLNARFNATNAVLDGIGISQTTADESTLKATSATLNSLSIVNLGNKPVSIPNEYEGAMILESDVSVSSQLAALRTLRLTPNQNIANLLVGGNIFTTFGGPSRAALPYHNTPFENLPVIEEELGWTSAEQDDLNNNGVAFLGNNPSLTSIISGEMVTTFLTNVNSVPSTTFKFLNAVDTSSTVREFFSSNNRNQYAQSVLTQGIPIANSDQVSLQSIKNFQIALYEDLSREPFGLVPNGDNATQFFSDNLSVTADFQTGTVDIVSIVPIVSQVRSLDGTLRISFTFQTGA